jgi:acyl-CoA synthetase (AMP-forming)/AMP-acid ligase II
MIFKELTYSSSPIAIEETGKILSIGELNVLTNQLLPFKIEKLLVFCLCENSIGSLAGYISFLRLGIVPVMLDAEQEESLMKNLLTIYQPAYIWLPQTMKNKLMEDVEEIMSFHSYVFLKTTFENNFKINNELALLLTTSGSTGSPKLVRLSYRNILNNAKSIAEYLNINCNERPVTSLPMYYSYGLSIINSHLIKGATILLTDKPVIQKGFWDFVKEQKATSIAGVPYTYEMLKRLRIFRMDLPELKTMTQAGGKLNANLAKEYIEQATITRKKFIIMYGQTEATARMSYLPFDKALEKYSSIGIAIPNGKFVLMDKTGREIVDPDLDGELVYYGSNVSLGYAECKEDLAKGDENNGTLYTGDIAHYDSDGFYYITGRKKRFVKIFGNRVNLDAIEQFVKTISSYCACVGVDDKIAIFTTDLNKEEEIKSLLVKKTGLNIRAFTVQVIDTIPKNPSGKIQYTELLKLIHE